MTHAENGPSETGRFRTAGKVFRDGPVLELVRDPGPSKRINLISWSDRVLQTGQKILHKGRIYEPLNADENVLKAIRFPTHVAPPETTRKLFDDVQSVLRSRLGQLVTCTKKLGYAMFASHMSPVLPMAPVTYIFAPPGSPKNILLQLLRAMCRRPLSLVGVTRADLRCLPMLMHPTLILDEPDLRSSTQSILLASARRGAYIRSGRRLLDLYGAKFILSGNLPSGTALGTDALRLSLMPAPGQLEPLDPATLEEIAEKFQARFLGYYLRNCHSVDIPKFDLSHLTLPIQDIARALGTAIVGDKQLQGEIPRLLEHQDEQIRADLSQASDAVVIEALLFFDHEGECSKIRAAKVAEQVTAIFRGRGDDREVSPEAVGWSLKRLAIPSGRLDRAGNGVELTPSTRRLIHRLALSYGVRAFPLGFRDGCKYCAEFKQGAARVNIRVAAS